MIYFVSGGYGPESGAQLADGGPWMGIFAAAVGATDLQKDDVRRRVLDAIGTPHAHRRNLADYAVLEDLIASHASCVVVPFSCHWRRPGLAVRGGT